MGQIVKIVLLLSVLLATISSEAWAQASQMNILSGDWASDCEERQSDSGPIVLCQRFGGFVTNTYPAGCDGSSVFICRGVSMCEVAKEVTIIDSSDYRRVQSDIERCDGPVRRPPTSVN